MKIQIFFLPEIFLDLYLMKIHICFCRVSIYGPNPQYMGSGPNDLNTMNL